MAIDDRDDFRSVDDMFPKSGGRPFAGGFRSVDDLFTDPPPAEPLGNPIQQGEPPPVVDQAAVRAVVEGVLEEHHMPEDSFIPHGGMDGPPIPYSQQMDEGVDDYPNRVTINASGKVHIPDAQWMQPANASNLIPELVRTSFTSTASVIADTDVWFCDPLDEVYPIRFKLFVAGVKPGPTADENEYDYTIHVASIREIGSTGVYSVENHVRGVIDATCPNRLSYAQKYAPPYFMLDEDEFFHRRKNIYGAYTMRFQKKTVPTAYETKSVVVSTDPTVNENITVVTATQEVWVAVAQEPSWIVLPANLDVYLLYPEEEPAP